MSDTPTPDQLDTDGQDGDDEQDILDEIDEQLDTNGTDDDEAS